MQPVLVVAFFVGAIGLVVWSIAKTRRFESAYRYDGGFDGALYGAELRYPQHEDKIVCRAGANPGALFLLCDPAWKARSWARDQGRSALRHGLRIPWSQITCRVSVAAATSGGWR